MTASTKGSIWGDCIARHLRQHQMTHTELARLAGINRSTVTHIVRGGGCHTDTLERIAAALGVPVADRFQVPVDIGVRRDKIVAAVLRELSDAIGVAVDEHLSRRRKAARGRRAGDRRLPFSET
jgi:transcriptional regulator with XRE-family HTH domain